MKILDWIRDKLRRMPKIGEKVQIFNPGALPRSNPWYFATVAEIGVDGKTAHGLRHFFAVTLGGRPYYQHEEETIWRHPPIWSWDQ
jgi:hypothetical protein